MHRARLSLVPLNAYSRRAGADRRCGYEQETLPHVTNHCLQTHAEAYQLRHDAILARLKNATPVFPGDDVRVNRLIRGHPSAPTVPMCRHVWCCVCVHQWLCSRDLSATLRPPLPGGVRLPTNTATGSTVRDKIIPENRISKGYYPVYVRRTGL